MLNLNDFSKGNLKKFQRVLGIILDAWEFKPAKENAVFIPQKKFDQVGLTFQEVNNIIDKIERDNYVECLRNKMLKDSITDKYRGISDLISFLRKWHPIVVKNPAGIKEIHDEINKRLGTSIKAIKQVFQEMDEKEDFKKDIIIEEIEKGKALKGGVKTQNSKPYTEVKSGKGYFKFYKQGENIEVGKPHTRHFRLLQCLCEPYFGVQKTIEAIFDAIRLPKDKNDSDLSDWSPQRQTKILTLIEYAKKELQKNKKLQGKLKYRFDDRKRNMWLE